MPPPLPLEEIAPLMQFIAEKAKNVTSPMSVLELCRQFKAEKDSSLSMKGVEARIRLYRHRIHEMNEFDMDTKINMMFALRAPIDSGFLIEMKKVADVEVDDQQRIIHYKKKDGGLELSAKYKKFSTDPGAKRDSDIIQFLTKKSETVGTPIPDNPFLREFKETTGCTDSLDSLRMRYRRVRETIYESTGIDRNTKIKMMFISNVKLSDETLKELRKDAVVEVDSKERIIKYKRNDGRLELEGRRGLSSREREFEENQLTLCTTRWSEICEKVNKVESGENEKKVSNWQEDYEKKRIDLVRFLIKRTEDAKYPISIPRLAADFKTEFNSSESQKTLFYRIENFRQRIHEMNQFDMPTKVKMMFALSAPVDEKFLEEIQNDAFVELDEMKRIKKYKANDGSLELEIDHLLSGKVQEGKTNVLNESTGERYSQSCRLSQNLATIQKGRKRMRQISEDDDDGESLKVENKNKKIQLSEKNSESARTLSNAIMSMTPPLPPEEIAPLMHFIAEKAMNVTSPMNITELCRQYKDETGSSVLLHTLCTRIHWYRLKIHEMNEFDMVTKVKMLFALSTPIDAGFLIEMKKVADVKVDYQRRIIHYKQKDGGLELSSKYLGLLMNQRDRDIIQFLAEKSKTTDEPIADRILLREFKAKTGCIDSIEALDQRYRRVREAIYQSTGIDNNTKIKMMFISNVNLSDEILKELREDADVEVDYRGRITKYKSTDGSLNLKGSHEMSFITKSFYSDRWHAVCEKIAEVVSEQDDRKDAKWQKDFERKLIDLIRFLIERTKNATSPLSLNKLAKDYKAEFKCSESLETMKNRIIRFRPHIHELNQLDNPTKVRLAFALSASIDADFLKELQKDAIVELDNLRRIKKYRANDAASAKRTRIVNNSGESTGEKYAQSTRLSQSPAAIQKERKRARVEYSSSEVFEDIDDHEESMTREMMDYDTNNVDNGRYDYFYHDPPYYEEDMEHIQMEKKPESLVEVNTEMPSTSSVTYHYEDNFDYDPSTYEEDMELIPVEKKPENYIEVKLEIPEESSANNLEYHNEDILTEPKPE